MTALIGMGTSPSYEEYKTMNQQKEKIAMEAKTYERGELVGYPTAPTLSQTRVLRIDQGEELVMLVEITLAACFDMGFDPVDGEEHIHDFLWDQGLTFIDNEKPTEQKRLVIASIDIKEGRVNSKYSDMLKAFDIV